RRPKLCMINLPGKGLDTGNFATTDKAVVVVGTFIGIDGFQIHHMVDYTVLSGNSISAMHIPCSTCNVERRSAIIAFNQRYHIVMRTPLIPQFPQTPGQQLHLADICHHIGQLSLRKLISGTRMTKLCTFCGILARFLKAKFSSTDCSPAYAISD